jgi:hypothetical protein
LEPLGSIEFSFTGVMMSTALWGGESLGEACDPVENTRIQISSTFRGDVYGGKSYNAETDIKDAKIETGRKSGGVISCLCRNAEAAEEVGKYGENRKVSRSVEKRD